MEFIGKYENWYNRLIEAGYDGAEYKVKSFMEAHNDIIWEKKLSELINKGMNTRTALNKINILREAFAGDGKCEKFVQSVEKANQKNK
tara:strand:+ start:637 stop:900 length:264 start_codon:yes stop_codon:yes gene_type:complete